MTERPNEEQAPEMSATPEAAPEAAASEAASIEQVIADKYEAMLALARSFDAIGVEMRRRAGLGAEILSDEDVKASADLSPTTWREAEEDILAATSGRGGLLDHSLELDADALIIRATVMTYRWIDELRAVAERTLGSVAGRAIGYLAPEIALGGAIVSAGLIETDAMDRDGLAAYLNELADNNPELMDHITSGGGGLLDRLEMRALLTVGLLGGPQGSAAAGAGLRSIGAGDFAADATDAWRDLAGGYDSTAEAGTSTDGSVAPSTDAAPANLEALMTALTAADELSVHRVGEQRYIAYLPGRPARRGELTLVGSDRSGEVAGTLAALSSVLSDGDHVMLVASGAAGVTAAELAAADTDFTVDQVVTVGAPAAQATPVPESARVLSLEDRSDPVALLGSLINQPVTNRLTIVYDAGTVGGAEAYVAGGRAADAAAHEELRAELGRFRSLGYLAG